MKGKGLGIGSNRSALWSIKLLRLGYPVFSGLMLLGDELRLEYAHILQLLAGVYGMKA